MKKLSYLLMLIAALGLIVLGCKASSTNPMEASPSERDGLNNLSKATAAASSDEHRLSTKLRGAAEVPGPGDPDGRGSAKIELKQDQGMICFKITVAKIAPATAAHIHAAPAGVAGPVVVTLTPPTSGSSRGCVSGVDPELIKAIRRNPSAYYINVHNAGFPAGAVRGQLSKKKDDSDDDDD